MNSKNMYKNKIENIDKEISDNIKKKGYIISEVEKDNKIAELESVVKYNGIIIDLQQEVIKEKDETINLLKKHYGINN